MFQKFQTVVITSGTLSPIDLYPRILNFNPVAILSLAMTLTRCYIAHSSVLCKNNVFFPSAAWASTCQIVLWCKHVPIQQVPSNTATGC